MSKMKRKVKLVTREGSMLEIGLECGHVVKRRVKRRRQTERLADGTITTKSVADPDPTWVYCSKCVQL